MGRKTSKIIIYLIVFILLVLTLFLVIRFIFNVKDITLTSSIGLGAIIVAMTSALTKSKRQKKMYDKHMESFYFQQSKRNF